MKLICLSFQWGFRQEYRYWHWPCLQDRFRNSLWIPSSVACSKSESGFLIKCLFGLLLMKPSGWRPLNWWTNRRAAFLIRSVSLGSLENKAMQILGSKVKGCPDWCIWIRSASLDHGQCNVNLWIFSNSNELNGTWNVLFSESQVEKMWKTLIVENVNWNWEFSDWYGGNVILRINGCNAVILLTAGNAFLFFKAKEVQL